METYQFKGKVNFDLVASDARKDDLFAFIIVTPSSAYLGVTTEWGNIDQACYTFETVSTYEPILNTGYFIVGLRKKELIPKAIEIAKRAKKQVLKQRRKAFREARENADKTVNKVMGFGVEKKSLDYLTVREFWKIHERNKLFFDNYPTQRHVHVEVSPF